MVRLRQSPASQVPHQQFQEHLEYWPRQPEGKVRPILAEYISRHAEHMLWNKIIATPHANERFSGMNGRLARNVGSRIASPHHQHPLPVKLLPGLEAVRMTDLSIKLTAK